MSKPVNRLARLLDTPHLERVVPQLAPEALHQIIRHHGLDACGELVAAATPEQLTSVLDVDLWRNTQPGQEEQFDVERFGEWIEVLADTGDSVAARTVAAIDKHLVIAGLSRYMRVFDPGTFEPTASSDDERPAPLDSRAFGGFECEVSGYLVRAKRTDAWDAIVALLLALEAEHYDYFTAVMQGCRRLSNSRSEIDGLDDLLTAPEQHLHDVAIEREHRRSQRGYSTPAEARAYLQMARQPRHQRQAVTQSFNPIAAAYFRSADEEAAESASADSSAAPTRSQKLAFLANTLIAGCSVQSRPFTAQEAAEAALGICNLGIEHWPARWPGATTEATTQATTHDAASMPGAGATPPDTTLPGTFLVEHELLMAFEVGWAVLQEDVSMFVADRLIATLTDLQCADVEIQRGLQVLRRELVKQRDAGTPWHARNALDVLAMLDMTAWASLRGLLGECPVMPAALTAILERHTKGVDAEAFAFITTRAQIRAIQTFMEKLVDVLIR